MIAWDEVIDGVRRAAVVTATRGPGDALQFGPPSRLGDRSAAYPVLAVSNRQVITAWADGIGVGSAIVVK